MDYRVQLLIYLFKRYFQKTSVTETLAVAHRQDRKHIADRQELIIRGASLLGLHSKSLSITYCSTGW